jgi:hypothetical protein
MLIEAAKGGQFDIMNLLLDWPSSGSVAGGVAALPSVCDQLNKVTSWVFAYLFIHIFFLTRAYKLARKC